MVEIPWSQYVKESFSDSHPEELRDSLFKVDIHSSNGLEFSYYLDATSDHSLAENIGRLNLHLFQLRQSKIT